MAKDPAFLFYPGDYLRDTQCLSEPVQVAYDRIMCEHMRNICISQEQLNFFTKRLTGDQKIELMMVLLKVDGGYQISWVAESIEKRREYSESRRKNRNGSAKNNKKHINNISKTYVKHMENENEIVIENINDFESNFEKAFDEITLETYKIAFKGIDLLSELQRFRIKCDNDKQSYYHRDKGGLRNAFQYQLQQIRNGKKQQPTLEDSNKRINDLIDKLNIEGTI